MDVAADAGRRIEARRDVAIAFEDADEADEFVAGVFVADDFRQRLLDGALCSQDGGAYFRVDLVQRLEVGQQTPKRNRHKKDERDRAQQRETERARGCTGSRWVRTRGNEVGLSVAVLHPGWVRVQKAKQQHLAPGSCYNVTVSAFV